MSFGFWGKKASIVRGQGIYERKYYKEKHNALIEFETKESQVGVLVFEILGRQLDGSSARAYFRGRLHYFTKRNQHHKRR